MGMKFKHGWYMPETEVHLIDKLEEENGKVIVPVKGKFSYQFPKFWLCMALLTGEKRNAIDIGSNIGLWTFCMADFFDFVYCFEPVKITQECWIENLKKYNNVKLYPFALGDKEELVNMYIPRDCAGGAYISDIQQADNQERIDNIKVDKLDNYNFKNVDFIKIDVQGYELEVLKGGKETILENKPMILIEQKNDNLEAVEYLTNLGMSEIADFRGDYIIDWKAPSVEYVQKINKTFNKIFWVEQ